MTLPEDSFPGPVGTGLKVLHVASECFPLAKTGGLGDMVGSLSAAQRSCGIDARVVLPCYAGLIKRLEFNRVVSSYEILQFDISIIEGTLRLAPGDAGLLPVYLVSCAELFERGGDPYRDEDGQEYTDNALRFACFSRAAAQLALDPGVSFNPDVVHLHDWHTALTAGWIRERELRPSTVLTIHNLAFQGLVDRAVFDQLQLPEHWWSPQGVEFWGRCSFLKGGIRFADRVTTVSATYAAEVLTADYGCGLDSDLRALALPPLGIGNGMDTTTWDPRHDARIFDCYGVDDAARGKMANKNALQARLGLERIELPLVAYVGRLSEQKGADIILAASQQLLRTHAQYVILGEGTRELERGLLQFAGEAPPGRVHVSITHDETLAHRILAAADLLMMPSRIEPCGLSQMCAQRFGTLPVVRATGGLIDTVVHADPAALAEGVATGVHFRDADVGGLLWGLQRGLQLWENEETRERLRRTGMDRDFSWGRPASDYLRLYRSLREEQRDLLRSPLQPLSHL